MTIILFRNYAKYLKVQIQSDFNCATDVILTYYKHRRYLFNVTKIVLDYSLIMFIDNKEYICYHCFGENNRLRKHPSEYIIIWELIFYEYDK